MVIICPACTVTSTVSNANRVALLDEKQTTQKSLRDILLRLWHVFAEISTYNLIFPLSLSGTSAWI